MNTNAKVSSKKTTTTTNANATATANANANANATTTATKKEKTTTDKHPSVATQTKAADPLLKESATTDSYYYDGEVMQHHHIHNHVYTMDEKVVSMIEAILNRVMVQLEHRETMCQDASDAVKHH
jgi:gamma-glutamylcyclotransferase (GGCT)/AIG2-like uncharacterized protein YtfP